MNGWIRILLFLRFVNLGDCGMGYWKWMGYGESGFGILWNGFFFSVFCFVHFFLLLFSSSTFFFERIGMGMVFPFSFFFPPYN